MEYGHKLAANLITFETRIATNNPSVPMIIYRQVNITLNNNILIVTT
jgi:hypothetical protein